MDFDELKDEILKLNKSNGEPWPVYWQMMWIMEEFGELSGEILKSSNIGGRWSSRKKGFNKSKIIEEFGDVMYGMISLADGLDFNPLDALQSTLNKFKDRKQSNIK